MGEVIEPHDAADDAVSTIVASQSKSRRHARNPQEGEAVLIVQVQWWVIAGLMYHPVLCIAS